MGSALAEAIRERVDPHEMIDVALALLRGEPMVRVVDRATGRPRLADSPSRNRAVVPGEARPVPISEVGTDEIIHDVVWPTRSEMMAAATWLATMGGMKPPTEIETTVHQGDSGQALIDFERLSPAELDAYVKLVDKASGGESQVINVPQLVEGDEPKKT